MISNQLSNNLRFSTVNYGNNDKIGILNQNPLIITKSEAFTFSYTDPDKIKYAQLLAKRDLQNLKCTDPKVELPENVVEPPGRCKKAVKISATVQKKKFEERVSSIKRVPGPQVPSKVINIKRDRPSIMRSAAMPARSMSPPVRDTDTNWRPNENVPAVDRLQLQLNQCTNKLDRLEQTLRTQSKKNFSQSNVPFLRHNDLSSKTNRDLQFLETKLRSLVDCATPREIQSAARNVIHLPREPVIPIPRPNIPIENILMKLDCLSSEMDTIRARWTSLPYEVVSICGDDNDNDGNISDTFRFTKQTNKPWTEPESQIEDRRVCLDVPSQLVARLDRDRHRFLESVRFPNLVKHQVSPTRAGEWFSEDILNEVVEEVIKEFDDTSGQLVEAILNDELTD